MQSTEPFLKQNWTESNPIVLSPIEGVAKPIYPEVCKIFRDCQSFFFFENVRILQKYQRVIEKLRDEYYQDTTNITAIKTANAVLLSDMVFNEGITKTAVLQTIANTRQKCQPKNTFLFRSELDFI